MLYYMIESYRRYRNISKREISKLNESEKASCGSYSLGWIWYSEGKGASKLERRV